MPAKISSKRILIAGCGKIGLQLARRLAAAHQVWGLKRGEPAAQEGIEVIRADVTQISSLAGKLPDKLDYLVYCLTPGERTEQSYRQVYVEGLKNLLSAMPQKQPLSRLYFISSTSVYGQDGSEWVDENSSTEPTGFSGRVLLQAEALVAAGAHPSTIVRFSGIYGGSRSRLIEQVRSGDAVLSSEHRLSNRIHEQDCVGFLYHLLQEDISGRTNQSLYLASDSEPVDLNAVLKFLAKHLSVELEPSDGPHHSRRAGNKKCSNRRMLESGYQLRFPGYREGYLAMLDDF